MTAKRIGAIVALVCTVLPLTVGFAAAFFTLMADVKHIRIEVDKVVSIQQDDQQKVTDFYAEKWPKVEQNSTRLNEHERRLQKLE